MVRSHQHLCADAVDCLKHQKASYRYSYVHRSQKGDWYGRVLAVRIIPRRKGFHRFLVLNGKVLTY